MPVSQESMLHRAAILPHLAATILYSGPCAIIQRSCQVHGCLNAQLVALSSTFDPTCLLCVILSKVLTLTELQQPALANPAIPQSQVLQVWVSRKLAQRMHADPYRQGSTTLE